MSDTISGASDILTHVILHATLCVCVVSEYMTGIIYGSPAYVSALSLALMQDSGWYQV